LAYITAFSDYAIEGYRTEPLRYLLKRNIDQLLPECVEAMLNKLLVGTRTVTYDLVNGRRKLHTEQISYIESQGHRLIFHIRKADAPPYHLYAKLDEVETDLTAYGFIRIHKSYLVNIKCIKELKNYNVAMETDILLPIPKAKYRHVKERYFEMKGDL
jgi:DNA-binding LytR/AlgR family response regulator